MKDYMSTNQILFREDIVCHDYKAGLIQVVYGDPYGRPVLSNPTGSDVNSPNPFRFCHIDHQHPEKPTVITRDINGRVKFTTTKSKSNINLTKKLLFS